MTEAFLKTRGSGRAAAHTEKKGPGNERQMSAVKVPKARARCQTGVCVCVQKAGRSTRLSPVKCNLISPPLD